MAPWLDDNRNENLVKSFCGLHLYLAGKYSKIRRKPFGFGSFIFPESKLLGAQHNVNSALTTVYEFYQKAVTVEFG